MFKKITSKRNPEHTLYSEIKKEFSVYFNTAGVMASRLLLRFPRFFFGSMVFLMMSSIVLSFIILHKPNLVIKPTQKANALQPVDQGINEVLTIKKRLDRLSRLSRH